VEIRIFVNIIYLISLVISCELEQDKEFKNENTYNHNFSFKYCHCDKEECDEMLQCLICEDWFHSLCLNMKVIV
jgi:E3 ubiquitin-protein ligase UBR7